MIVGVLRESLAGETRVAATPATVAQLLKLGYEVVVESCAEAEAGFFDEAYVKAGARIGDPAAAGGPGSPIAGMPVLNGVGGRQRHRGPSFVDTPGFSRGRKRSPCGAGQGKPVRRRADRRPPPTARTPSQTDGVVCEP